MLALVLSSQSSPKRCTSERKTPRQHRTPGMRCFDYRIQWTFQWNESWFKWSTRYAGSAVMETLCSSGLSIPTWLWNRYCIMLRPQREMCAKRSCFSWTFPRIWHAPRKPAVLFCFSTRSLFVVRCKHEYCRFLLSLLQFCRHDYTYTPGEHLNQLSFHWNVHWMR